MKIKQILLLLAILSCSLACKDSKKEESPTPADVCTIDNPLVEIAWLKTMHETFQMSMSPIGNRIIQYEYNGECVFLIDDCYNCPDGLILVYNAAQEVICEFGGIAGLNTCPDFEQEATNKIILWDNVG